MTRFGLLVAMLLLLGGCFEDPLLPELKGRWSSEQLARIRSSLLTNGSASASEPNLKDVCRTQYVTFDKRAVTLHSDDRAKPFFMVREMRRDGSRLVLVGASPFMPIADFRVDLVVGNGEIRFQDISDIAGSFRDARSHQNEKARRLGTETAGEVFRLFFDLKSCRT